MIKRMVLFSAIVPVMTLLLLSGASAELRGYDPAGKNWQYISLGTYPTSADGSVSSILWRVLDVTDNVAYAISENILEAKQLHHTYDPYPGWLESDLYAYLNQDFYRRAFSETERSLLTENPAGGVVTLPSVEDIRDPRYGFTNDKSRECQSTAYADTTGLYYYHRNAYYYHPFWTRTTSEVRLFAQRCTKLDGKIGYLAVTAKDLGVRPVILIDFDMVSSIIGSGTLADPFILSSGKTASVIIANGDPENEGLATDPALSGEIPDVANSLPIKTNEPVSFNPLFPGLTNEGFLLPGGAEFVYNNNQDGVWLYCSQTLRIEIERHYDASENLRWLVANIYAKGGYDAFRMVANDSEHMKSDLDKYLKKPVDIARNNKLVFAMNGDYFIYRVRRSKEPSGSSTIGIEIRDGKILYDSPAKATRALMPNLDMLALFADGDMRVFRNDEIKSEELLFLGASDVLSFGPYLIRDGQIDTRFTAISNGGTTPQPRTAIGMVKKGHYVSLVVEGRISESKGTTIQHVGEMMADLGCTVAFNLDGGWTSAMVFMGEQLNQLGKYQGSSNARTQNELLGIGHTLSYTAQ